ncbi:MAG: S1 RNA-binding domain-containing protein, partial [Myxococcota bacterium]
MSEKNPNARRRSKNAPPPKDSNPNSMPSAATPARHSAERVEHERAAETGQPLEEKQTLDAQALVNEINDIDPDELSAMLSMGAPRRFSPGDKVSGEIVRINRDAVFVAIGAKAEAILDREELEQEPELGDVVEAYVLRVGGRGIRLSKKLGGKEASIDTFIQAMDAGVPVEGRIKDSNAGGFTVQVGNFNAFCPRSQIDRIVGEDLEQYVGQTYAFRVIDVAGSKVVLSRRELLDEQVKEQAAALWENTRPGDTAQGIVANVRDFVVFVDIGGIQGLVPKSELGWGEDTAPPKRGDAVTVRVLDIDPGAKKLTLSMKDPAFSPWAKVGVDFVEGGVYPVRVVRITDFGAFVEMAPGLQGLVHISNLAKKHVSHPGDVVKVGDKVDARLLGIDVERQRLDLGIKQADDESYDAEAEETRRAVKKQPRQNQSLGTMADLFSGLKLK